MAHAHTVAVRAAGHEVVAISSSSESSAARAAQNLGISRVFATASELIEAEIVDVVHVCTPNRFHLEQSQAAILSGKPVVCEKPLSMTLAEADQMLTLAQSCGVPTAVPFIYRYFEAATRMHAQLRALADDSTSEGRLTRLDGAYLQDWLLAPGSTNWRVDPALGGQSRVFADIGIHWCDLMEFVTGHRITRLQAKFSNLYADRPTEDTAEVDFETDLGATGRVVVSQVAEGHQNSLEFSFQAGEAGLGVTQAANSGQATAPTNSPTNPPIAWKQADSNDYQPAFNRFMADAYVSFVASVSAPQGSASSVGISVPEGGSYGDPYGSVSANLPTFADGRRAASLIDAVVRSARTGEWVTPL